MPKKNTTKLKQLNKNKNKKKRKQQQKQQQNEKENKKQEKALARELRNREPLYEKQKEEIEIVSTMYELTPILTPSSQIIQMNDDNLFTANDDDSNISNIDKEKKLYSNIFDMEVVAHPGEMEKNHCSITLRVRYIVCM